jgi:hypothetical protein
MPDPRFDRSESDWRFVATLGAFFTVPLLAASIYYLLDPGWDRTARVPMEIAAPLATFLVGSYFLRLARHNRDRPDLGPPAGNFPAGTTYRFPRWVYVVCLAVLAITLVLVAVLL